LKAMLTKIEHGDILELRLERPPVNALHHPLVQELKAAIEAAPKAGAEAVVLSGMAGMYSAGLDVPYLLGLDKAGMERFWTAFFDMLRSIATSPIPVVAAITGHSPRAARSSPSSVTTASPPRASSRSASMKCRWDCRYRGSSSRASRGWWATPGGAARGTRPPGLAGRGAGRGLGG